MGSTNRRQMARIKRKTRIRKKLAGSQQRPRLCVYRSAKHIYAQIIDDSQGRTLVTASSLEKAVRTAADIKNKMSTANLVGKLIAERALKNGIKQIVFDRNGFLYHGRIKAVSDGARETGLAF